MDKEQEKVSQLMRSAGKASVAVALILVAIKLFAWNRTGSVSIFASFIDSGMDALASIINLIAIKYALEPADDEHRYGHGKVEALAGLAQASFIAGSAFILLLNAIDRIFKPTEMTQIDTGIYVMAISLVFTIALVLYQKSVVKKTGSLAVKADSLHYLSDVLGNLAAIGALFLTARGIPYVDIIVGLLIGFFILKSAWDIVKDSLDVLMDRELPDEVKKEIADIKNKHSKVHGFHDMKTRQTGLKYFIQFHVEVNDDLSLMEAHEVSEEIEDSLKKAFPNSESIVHIDPKSLYKNRPREGFSNP
ncbi:MAG: cation diffusion facilitator family transporter [Lentisphaeraceae bacterium]|nr:cation diffusion facilitator family transporter [Lentisphaeraceae bacterium]